MTTLVAQSRPVDRAGVGDEGSFEAAPPMSVALAGLTSAGLPDHSGWNELRLWSATLEDQQDHRKRVMNRLGLKADGSPQVSGARVPESMFARQVEAIEAAEHLTALAMRRCYRRVVPEPIREWQTATFGVGEHLLARLLGALGHPRIATPYHWEGEGEDRKLIPDLAFERSLRQLWSYCGHGDAERKKRKGMSAHEAFALGSPRCKMLVHLLAEATIKCRVGPIPTTAAMVPAADPISPPPPMISATAGAGSAGGSFDDRPESASNASQWAAGRRHRALYDARRAHTSVTHADWTDGHSHADALRIVGKQLLRELWEVSP